MSSATNFDIIDAAAPAEETLWTIEASNIAGAKRYLDFFSVHVAGRTNLQSVHISRPATFLELKVTHATVNGFRGRSSKVHDR